MTDEANIVAAARGALSYLLDGTPMKDRSPAELRTVAELAFALMPYSEDKERAELLTTGKEAEVTYQHLTETAL